MDGFSPALILSVLWASSLANPGALRHEHAPESQAVRAIVSAFAGHPIVAIAESHGLRQAGDFYVSLVRDTAFQRLAPDIVVEFASRQSQPLLDAYVVRGDSLPIDSVRSIWRNTTKVASWESPIYARWLEAIRTVNLGLPPTRRLRVIAADTRVDWTAMHGPADWAALGDNNVSFTHVITADVLARHRKAFVVLGSNHLTRTGTRDGGPNTTTYVEAQYPGSTFVVWMYTGRPGGDEADAQMLRERWTAPSLVPLRGTWAGAIRLNAHPMDEVADALLYLGPSTTLTEERPATDSFDLSYRRELDRRSWIEWSDSARARTFLKLDALTPAGEVKEFRISDTLYRRSRRVWVYTPPGYPATCGAGCSLLLAFDGGVYLDAIPLPTLLDSLTGTRAISPTVAVLVDNASSTERLADLANHAKFVAFVGDQLVPWVRGRWRVSHDPARSTVTGSSAGGLAAAYIALRRPDLFGNVLSQSGAFWRGDEGSNTAPFEWLTTQYATEGMQQIRFFLDVGSTESTGAMGGTAPSILDANRRLRDTLRAKGYDVAYYEVTGGVHAPSTWRTRLPIGLAALNSAR